MTFKEFFEKHDKSNLRMVPTGIIRRSFPLKITFDDKGKLSNNKIGKTI